MRGAQVDGRLGHPRHARDAQRFPDPGGLLSAGECRGLPVRRHPPVSVAQTNWFWGSYTAVYLGVAAAAYDELRRVVQARAPQGYAQPLAYHPDVRRHVARISADLTAARLATYHSAWLSDSEGPTPATTAALYRAKYLVGEATSRITRTALTLGGAHGIFKGSRLEQLFRDGAVAPIQPPPSDFCLHEMALYELGIDPDELLPPLKPL